MRGKPEALKDTNVDEWRAPDPEKIETRKDGRDARITKNTRMRLRFSEMLRDESYRQTLQQGRKVSEADLLDEALQDFRMKHGLSAE